MAINNNYYEILGITPWANERQIRSAYRDLSKLYHPDTTKLSPEVSLEKFKELNQAYATLSNPDRRKSYDQSIQFTRSYTFTVKTQAHQPLSYDNGLPSERPLSAGELFALFIIGLSLLVCLGLAIAVSILRGDQLLFAVP
ncbi:DnaJ-class molecular chaperone with C-terminal Zn finger domain [Synechococcus sp. PCC 7502]|uniref:J domain-containing protein n=1 Tax=Synechococcus sp. PCC 7502 TaxID=1173263 RepID=UPI00029FB66C|nr:J domain-containing protein [Synechococcus sp. PCC 7502]AFY72736.1 DnaJ-class molecular chaperone with C-terminal Zn finger domain [Synechococcus sp. PCC 7502]